MEIPLVCLISSYKEGKLIQGTIRSALAATPHVIVFEGCTEPEEVDGPATDLGRYRKYLIAQSRWELESEKRTAMLVYARRKIQKDFWLLLLDADEILVWGEYLRDWLNVLEPGLESPENIVPLKLTESNLDTMDVNGVEVPIGFKTFVTSSHLYHSSIIDHYDVGAWRIVTPFGQVAELSNRESERQPLYGEPHIHHRPYLRRGERAGLRLRAGEEKRWRIEHGLENE